MKKKNVRGWVGGGLMGRTRGGERHNLFFFSACITFPSNSSNWLNIALVRLKSVMILGTSAI